MKTFRTHTVSVSIARPCAVVYEYIANAANMPQWAFFRGAKPHGNDWIMDTLDGPVGLRFVEPNAFGVLDHYITLPTREELYVPMRVLVNGSGCEVLLSLFFVPGVSVEQFESDVRQVEQDLGRLKAVLETASG